MRKISNKFTVMFLLIMNCPCFVPSFSRKKERAIAILSRFHKHCSFVPLINIKKISINKFTYRYYAYKGFRMKPGTKEQPRKEYLFV